MRSALVLLLCFVTTFTAWAFDWGLNINEVPLVMTGQTTLYVETVKTKLWLTQPLFGSAFRVEGDGTFSMSSSGGAWTLSDPTIDLTELSLKGTTPLEGGAFGVLDWSLGRRSESDLTGGYVVSSRWDGGSFSWLQGDTKVSTSLGYSGLLLKKTARVSGSIADTQDSVNPNVIWAPQRALAMVGVSWTELLLRQDFQTEFVGDYDTRPGKNAVHGTNLTLATSGPLGLGWRQKLFFTGGLRITPSETSVGFLGGGEWSSSFPFLGSRLVLGAIGARGLSDAGFRTLSSKSLAEIVTLLPSEAADVSVDYSLKPISKMTLGFKTTGLFRTNLNPVTGLSGFKATSTDYWLGAEVGAYASWNPTSESSLAFTGGVFVPQPGAFVAGTTVSILSVLTMTLKL